jgi:hypothetical protein
MQPPPKGDPEFSILSPAAGTVFGPTFSVYGWGPQTLANVVAWAGGAQKTADLQPHPDMNSTNWEAIFTGMTTGSYGIYATSNNNGRTPASPNSVPVTVDAAPGIAIMSVTPPPQPMGVGAPDTNPWNGWKVEGTYDPAKINGVTIYLTRRGISFWKGLGGGRIEQAATLTPGTGQWTCNLSFMPSNAVGKGLHVHYLASRVNGGTVHGSLPSFFDGPQ